MRSETDVILLTLEMMRLKNYKKIGETVKELGGSLRSMGDLMKKASVAGIKAQDESMEAIADELKIVSETCKEQARELLEYLEEHVR